MSWIGAAIGAFLGSSRGGVLGGILGAVLGNWVEGKIRGETAASAPRPGMKEEVVVLTAISAMLAKLAKADGHISMNEVRYCENVFTRLGLRGEKREFCIRTFRQAKSDGNSIYDYAASFAAAQPDGDVRTVVYDILWDLACADGKVSPEEREILANIVRPLRIDPRLFAWHSARRGVSSSAQTESRADPYEVLGVKRSMSNDELRAAYREKAKRLHPDILRAQGLSEELLGRANEQMSRINAAWDEIKKERGI